MTDKPDTAMPSTATDPTRVVAPRAPQAGPGASTVPGRPRAARVERDEDEAGRAEPGDARSVADADAIEAGDAVASGEAAAEPMLLAQATTGAATATDASPAASGSAGAGAAASGSAGTGMMLPGLLAAGGLGLAVAGSGGSKGSSPAPAAQVPQSVPPDTTAPEAPTVRAVAVDDRVNGTERSAGVTVSGTAEAGSSVRVTWGTATRTVTAGADGDWSATFAAAEVPADGNVPVRAVATDAAGNASAEASRTVLVDTVAPVVQVQSADSTAGTVTLGFDGPIDPANPPPASAFSVTTNGAANPVASVAVAGGTVTLTLANAFSAGALTVAYADPGAGNDAAALQDAAGNDVAGFSSGIVADGYVRGASVWVDVNGNGVVDAGTDFLVGRTNADGHFFLPSGAPTGTIIAVGGVNVDTGVPNTIPLKAPAGSTTINPLTTLVQAVVEASGGTVTVEAAASTVATNLGLASSLGGASLLAYDPIASGNVDVQKVAAQVATIVTLAERAGAGAGEAVVDALVSTLAAATSPVDLLDTAVVGTVVTAAFGAANVSGAAATQAQADIGTATTAIATASSLADITGAQSQALDTVAPGAPTLTAAAATNDPTPTVRVSFGTAAVDGTAAVAGDAVSIKVDGTTTTVVVLTAADIAAGRVDVEVAALADGTRSLSASLSDQAGNTSALSVVRAVIVDATAPAAPTIGAVAGDGTIGASEQGATLSGTAEAGATVLLTLGAGNVRSVTANDAGTWSYTLVAADIAAMGEGAETISAQARDALGNTGAAGTRSVVVDTVAPAAPTIGTIAVDGTINAAEQGATLSGTAEAGSTVLLTLGV
ncbi:MAG TPA: Ig-like domain-containing protein, partial [Burkholderiaceae bacterium]|nr:Ig-like domain-containing protein [Burkholderiaceae bacterium]